MPYKSKWSIDIPQCSLPTLLFKSPTAQLSEKRYFSLAAKPDTHFLTRDSFRLWSQRFALGLVKSAHFKAGDRILLFSGNDLMFPVVFMGTLMAGGIFTGANPTFVARELAHQLRDSGATYLLCSDVAIETGIEAAKQANLSLDRVFAYNSDVYEGKGSAVKRTKYWGDLIASAEEAKGFAWDDLKGEKCHATLALNYSSGTTGVPKGVEITHFNYVSNTLQFAHLAQLHAEYEERNKRARWLCFLPMYHAMAQTIFIAGALLREIPVYVMPKFDFLEMLSYMERYRITDFMMVPPIAVSLAKHPAVKTFDLSSIETIGSGSAPLGRDVSAQVERLWPPGKLNMKQGWGMTECTCSLLGWNPNESSDSNSVGELNANCEAKIMNEEGTQEITARGPSATGELWCKAPNVMKGYWRNPKATAETKTPDGWLKTGDIAYADMHNRFFIVDRKKELIKVKANQVAPAELEALLLEHPAIADAAVIGLPTPDGDEAPRAYVVRQADQKSQQITQEEIARFVAERVTRYKRLTGGVVWIDAVPKNPSGKILRRALRDQAREETKQGSARL